MTRQPHRPCQSHLILETWRSQGQGQEPLRVMRFAKGLRAAPFSLRSGELPSASPRVPESLGHSVEER